MPRRGILVELHVVGIDHGRWCDACALPAAVDVRWAMASTSTLVVIARGRVAVCTGCGATWIPDAP